jgi:hypothetical protein
MAQPQTSAQLFGRVSRRLRWQRLASAFGWGVIACSGLYLLALVVRRATGVIPDLFHPITLLAIPALAALWALVWHRRPAVGEVARHIDQATLSNDLFLTVSLLKTSAGEYQPLVIQSAEERAGRCDAAAIAPLAWDRRYWGVLAAPALAAVLWGLLPQWDPFGKVAEAALVSDREERLQESRRETELRMAELKQKQEETEGETIADAALDDLQTKLGEMKPEARDQNLSALSAAQKQLAAEWNKLANEKLESLMQAADDTDQQFGGEELQKQEEWSEQLQAGSTDGLKKALEEIKDELERLQKTEDPVERQNLERSLKEKMESLDDFAQKKMDAKGLSAALQRAMKQLDLSKVGELSDEAADAMEESLELAQAELEELSQSVEDLKDLEQALKTLQMAKKLNDQKKLDGESQGKQCKSLADYEKLYRELLAQGGDGNGDGEKRGPFWNGGRGRGKGGEAMEDDSVKNDWQTEVSKSAVTAGKVLLSMKTMGEGEVGTVTKNYSELLNEVKQGVSEALQVEQVPPGYHEGIKSYFNALDERNAPQ